jgi:hypothetical protein
MSALLFFYQQQCEVWLNCCESWVSMGYMRDAKRCFEIATCYANAAISEKKRMGAA